MHNHSSLGECSGLKGKFHISQSSRTDQANVPKTKYLLYATQQPAKYLIYAKQQPPY